MMLNEIFPGKDIIFIAEIGMNHNGDPGLAREMIAKALEAGADAVKLQTFIPGEMNSVYSASLIKYGVEKKRDESQIEFFKKYELSEMEQSELFNYSNDIGLELFSSPFDTGSVYLLERAGIRLYKVASSEVTNHILLSEIAETGKPVIMSTGISTDKEISMAIETLTAGGTPEIVLMHCVSMYPLPPEKANLKRIVSLRERFSLEVGFSDHSSDFKTVEIAAALGARIFEKHFTLNSNIDCPDRNVSLEPEQFALMIKAVNNVAVSLGDGHITYDSSEKNVAISARRSLFARRHIPAGKELELDDVIPKRPGVGIPVYMLGMLLGRRSRVSIDKDFLIRKEYFE